MARKHDSGTKAAKKGQTGSETVKTARTVAGESASSGPTATEVASGVADKDAGAPVPVFDDSSDGEEGLSKDRRATDWRKVKKPKQARRAEKAKDANRAEPVEETSSTAAPRGADGEEGDEESDDERDRGSENDAAEENAKPTGKAKRRGKAKRFNWKVGTGKDARRYMESRWEEFVSDEVRRKVVRDETAEYVSSHYKFPEHGAGDVRKVRNGLTGARLH